jgi:hypothetical protein
MLRTRTALSDPPQLVQMPLVGRLRTTFLDSSHTRQHTMMDDWVVVVVLSIDRSINHRL